MGAIYVQVSAAEINNGIMTMSASGGEGGGQEVVSFWLNWSIDGFNGRGWYWDESYVSIGWSAYVEQRQIEGGIESFPYSRDEDGLKTYVATGVSNLDGVLGGWDENDKKNFVLAHIDELYGCLA